MRLDLILLVVAAASPAPASPAGTGPPAGSPVDARPVMERQAPAPAVGRVPGSVAFRRLVRKRDVLGSVTPRDPEVLPDPSVHLLAADLGSRSELHIARARHRGLTSYHTLRLARLGARSHATTTPPPFPGS